MATKIVSADISDGTIAATDLATTLLPVGTTTGTPGASETIQANYGLVIVDEYVMDATNELIFTDPSEMVVL